jgi:hypothetical protein
MTNFYPEQIFRQTLPPLMGEGTGGGGHAMTPLTPTLSRQGRGQG